MYSLFFLKSHGLYSLRFTELLYFYMDSAYFSDLKYEITK